MKKTQALLMSLFVIGLALCLLMVILFESNLLVAGGLTTYSQTEFLLTTLMELTTLGSVFLALRLFKFEKIHHDLCTRKESALQKWGVLRLLLLIGPMMINTLLYYLFMNPTFGYMAIIELLCLPFVFPSMNRCITETTEVE